MCYMSTMESYSALKKKEILPFTMAEDVKLSEVSQSQEDKY